MNRRWHRIQALMLIVIAAFPALLLLILGYRQRWVTDDAFITFRVVDQLLAGNGLMYNAGERVEAFTHPLWLAMLTLWKVLGGRIEIGSVVMGLAFTVGGLVAGQFGSALLIRRALRGPRDIPFPLCLPLGAIVFAAVPVAWDFATSGLETGLTFFWLGSSFLLLVIRCPRVPGAITSLGAITSSSHTKVSLTAVVLGLGPLIRPDLAVFSGAFLIALAFLSAPSDEQLSRGLRWRWWLRIILAAGCLPVAYQIFRMGYYAALVPNTALAKEAGSAYWVQGWRYLCDFVGTYHLWLLLLVILACWMVLARHFWSQRDRSALGVAAAPMLAALLHALWVTRVGGDFMHGRFLLPTLFGFLLPTMMVPVDGMGIHSWGRALMRGTVGLVIAWAVVCGGWLRVSYPGEVGPKGIADERGYYVKLAGKENPVIVDDFSATKAYRAGDVLRRQAERHQSHPNTPRLLLVSFADKSGLRKKSAPLSPQISLEIGIAGHVRIIGVAGFVAGPHVHVIDEKGLADPLASRMRLQERGRPGHEKGYPVEWILARFGARDIEASPGVESARAAIDCGVLAELRRAIEEPLTPGRFLRNLAMAFRFHGLRISMDPMRARNEVCTD